MAEPETGHSTKHTVRKHLTISILGSHFSASFPAFRVNVRPKHGQPTPLFWYITKVTAVEVPIVYII